MRLFYDDPQTLYRMISNASKRKPLPTEGDEFGHLTSTGRFGYTPSAPSQMIDYDLALECRCICCSVGFFRLSALRSGAITSCGCARQKTVIGLSRRHRSLRHKLNSTWYAMRSRCLDPRNENWINYGGRGITVSDEWSTFEPFFEWSIRSGFERGLTLDRTDNNGGYGPNNCRWATPKEQCRNFRRNVMVTAWGETKCLAEWAEDPRANTKADAIADRVRLGISPELAISTAKVSKGTWAEYRRIARALA